EYPSWFASWSHREASTGPAPRGGLQFCGTKGTLTISRKGFNIVPDRRIAPEDAVPQFGNPHPVGGPKRTGLEEALNSGSTWTESLEDTSGDEYDQFRRHTTEFLDCVRTRRQPLSDIESGHRVVTACHLANLSLRMGRRLSWNSEQEVVTNHDE